MPVSTIEKLIDRLANGGDVRQIKVEVAELVVQFLDQHRHTLTAEQKAHVVNAIGTLSLKRGSGRRVTAGDIYIALLDLQKAFAEPNAVSTPGERPSQPPVSALINVDLLRQASLASIQRAGNATDRQNTYRTDIDPA